MPKLTRITTAGLAAILAAQHTGAKLDITSFRIGTTSGFQPNPSETTPRNLVYTGNQSLMSYRKLDGDKIMIQITLDRTVGPFNVGNIALYLATGEMFSLTSLVGPSYKEPANSPLSAGNVKTYTIILQFSELAELFEFTINTIIEAAPPVVDTEDDLPDPTEADYPLYIVRRNSEFSNGPTFAYQDLDDDEWVYIPIRDYSNKLYAELVSSGITPSISITALNSVGIGHGAVIAGAPQRQIALGLVNMEGADSLAAQVGDNTLTYKTTGNRFIVLGYLNIAGQHIAHTSNVVVGGSLNVALGSYNSIFGGLSNSIGADITYSGIFAARSSQITGTRRGVAILGGYGHMVSADYVTVLGGGYANGRITGSRVMSNGRFTSNGDAQGMEVVARALTTNNTQTEVLIEGGNRLTLPNNTSWTFEVMVVARRTDTGTESAGYITRGVIRRGASASTTAIVGMTGDDVLAEDDSDWNITVNADTTNGSLRILVTGEVGKTIRWVARIRTVEVSN